MRRKTVFILLISIIMSSCHTKKPVDLIVTNATVYTIDEIFSKVESFAVADGKIVATGSTEEILAAYSTENILDGQGKFIYPGFNDAHAHFNGYGQNLMQYANLRGTPGPEEIYEIILAHHEK